MGKLFDSMQPEHIEFIEKQKVFFVGTAPLSAEGHVNISPKGYDTLRILSPTSVAYLDMTGSGNETSAHIEETGRLTIMFMAFEGAPMILRLYGMGQTVLPGTPEWDRLVVHFELFPGTRQIIYADIHAVKTSCGYSVPLMSFSGERDTLKKWAVNKGDEAALSAYRAEKNAVSMDGAETPLGKLYRSD